jgi:hypothetical protein
LEDAARLAAAPPPVRPKTATEILEKMAQAHAQAPAQALTQTPSITPSPTPAVPSAPTAISPAAVSAIVMASLPGLAGARVVSSVVVEDREAQKALWKGHRARFLVVGDVEHGVAAGAVIAALGRAASGPLLVARLALAERDWLVWVDMGQASCIAAFPNASLWFSGL